MRIIQCYHFLIGTKIPFDRWPGIVETFLNRLGLTESGFHYYFRDYDFTDSYRARLDGSKCKRCGAPDFYCEYCQEEARKYLNKGTACHRAARENPILGPIQRCTTKSDDAICLTNIGMDTGCTKADILPLMSKLYRRYGFAESQLVYQDVDFFSRRIPALEDESRNDPARFTGSSIILSRGMFDTRWNGILLNIEIGNGDGILDAAPYKEAMAALLPGIRTMEYVNTVLTPEEQAHYDALNESVKPLVAQAKDFFVQQMPEEKGNTLPDAPVRTSSLLKKLGKKYGYEYVRYEYYIYFMQKRTPNGHYIWLEFVSNPSSPDADPFVFFKGLGFDLQIYIDGYYPQNPEDALDYFTKFFDTLAQAERAVFPALDSHFPPTPEWYVPMK